MKTATKLNRLRLLLFLLVVLIIILSIIISIQQRRAERVSRPAGFEIIDGDTFIDSDGVKVRLLGIDTPEHGEPWFAEAGRGLERLLAGHELSLETGARSRDRYGRLLALVYADSLLVNEALVEQGLACTYFFPDDFGNPEMMENLCEAQRRARAAGVGIWSEPAPLPCDRYFGNRHTMRFHRPDCPSLSRCDTLTMLRLTTRGQFLDSCYSPCRNCKP